MDEKILIQSEKYDVKKACIVVVVIGVLISLFSFIGYISDKADQYDRNFEIFTSHYMSYNQFGNENSKSFTNPDTFSAEFKEHLVGDTYNRCYDCIFITKHTNKFSGTLSLAFGDEEEVLFRLIPIGIALLLSILIFFCFRSYELFVTDKRIYGKVAWGKQVDLPVDAISAISKNSLFKGISISTASGRISFNLIKNTNDIYATINKLLIERQHERAKAFVAPAPVATPSAPSNDEAEQIKKFKDLLDSGAITQEEYDAKKKQILGL